MLFVNRGNLTGRKHVREKFVECSGLYGIRIVPHERDEQVVAVGESAVATNGEVIFAGYILPSE